VRRHLGGLHGPRGPLLDEANRRGRGGLLLVGCLLPALSALGPRFQRRARRHGDRLDSVRTDLAVKQNPRACGEEADVFGLGIVFFYWVV
jgi:hypothetical protein